MVKTEPRDGAAPLQITGALVWSYVVIVALTLVALLVLGVAAPLEANENAWGHAVVVAVFAVVLPLRLRSARAGTRSAVRALGLIAAVLFVVNVVEALIPSFVPGWMRLEMLVIAVLMVGIVLEVARWAVRSR
ncbi:hypothetical protein EDF64_11557 [Curtobacterium flaccumfaciens]|uniref:Integral membrane protein n=1 Tax=Curtobacterium flaccumfaciens TaxID=2035 RepID=A0A4R6DD73_9MICO|nr:hypothetical protein [Curtobacterium flaccumfaciens]TDN41868.1 hypothetical protein EDF64_11557 [Curtobacterium flaccumfaciens]